MQEEITRQQALTQAEQDEISAQNIKVRKVRSEIDDLISIEMVQHRLMRK